MKVAVVGAGWAGLSAAVELTAAGAQVTVFESARQPGGRARQVLWDDQPLDNGQHLLVGAYTATLDLLTRIGVDPETRLLRLPLQVDAPGHFSLRLPRIPAPLHAAAGLLMAHGATLADKCSAIRLMDRLRRKGFRLERDTTVAAWLDAAGQRSALRRHLWDPLCLAALNTPPATASAQVFANVLRDTLGAGRTATDFLIPRRDLGSLLPEPAVRWLKAQGASVRLSTRVHAIMRADPAAAYPNGSGGWQLVAGFDEAQAVARYDALIIATPVRAAAGLLAGIPGGQALNGQLSQFTFEPIGTVYVRYPPATRLPGPLLALPGPIGQWVFDRGQFSGTPGLLAHVLSASGPWADMDNRDLGEVLHTELAALVPGLPPAEASFAIREQRATYACVPGLRRPDNRTPLPGLWLAGDYTAGDYPATLEMAVRSGRDAARGVLTERAPDGLDAGY